MDSVIPLGQKNTLAEYMIHSGANNRPPILDKDLYDSWKCRMELYMQNREHGRMILKSKIRTRVCLLVSVTRRQEQGRQGAGVSARRQQKGRLYNLVNIKNRIRSSCGDRIRSSFGNRIRSKSSITGYAASQA
ncbi:hypothetical protein Tco_0589061 [Tanacetum coccineum]